MDLIDDMKALSACLFLSFIIGLMMLSVIVIDDSINIKLLIVFGSCFITGFIIWIVLVVDRWYYWNYGDGKDIVKSFAEGLVDHMKENKEV